MTTPILSHPTVGSPDSFPPFSVTRLLKTVFNPTPGERVAILIDLDDPATEMLNLAFLQNPKLSIQRYAHDIFYTVLKESGLAELNLTGGDMFAYKVTGGSNLDLPDEAFDAEGGKFSLEKDIYPNYNLILCISTFSATAPLTAFAKKYGFRGATLHGLNQIIIDTGLSVDYAEVSRKAEKMRLGMTNADWVEIDFEFFDQKVTLRLDLDKQDAQKSHGLCLGGPDIANLPAGEIYYVPTSANGAFPMRYEDGSIGLMHVKEGRVTGVDYVRGSEGTIREHLDRLAKDPVTGEIGELGFGTQRLPISGKDIQDEKILGTIHVATGRSDHLGGHLTPDKFASSKNATHDDILFAPHKTPEFNIPQVRMHRNGETVVLLENFLPAAYLQQFIEN